MNNTLRYLSTTYILHLAHNQPWCFALILTLAAVVAVGLVRGE